MGTIRAALAATEAGPAAARRPPDAQRPPLETGHGRALARPAGAVRALADRLYPLPPLDAGRGLGPAPRGGPTPGGCRGRARLGPALGGRHGDPGAPARGRGKGGDPAPEALGRSQGGFSTKVHLRAEAAASR